MLTFVKDGSFLFCFALTDLGIPESLTTVEGFPFVGVYDELDENLTDIVIPLEIDKKM